jgi:hypothetical protein
VQAVYFDCPLEEAERFKGVDSDDYDAYEPSD